MKTEETEFTDVTLTVEQETTEVAKIAQASIANIAQNTKAYEELRDKYKGTLAVDFKDPDFKAVHKKLTTASGELVKARTAATKLVKSETDKLKQVVEMVKGEGDKLIAITAETEREIKAQKEICDDHVENHKQELIRIEEEKKQARVAALFALGATFNGSYYQVGELTITPIQIVQNSEAQFEGFVAQAKVAYEAEQLRIAEEKEAADKKAADDKKATDDLNAKNKLAQDALEKENKAKQDAIDAQNAQIEELKAQLALKDKIINTPLRPAANGNEYTFTPPVNGTPVASVKFTEEEKQSIIEDVLTQPDDSRTVTAELTFTNTQPFIDVPIGKSILRVYVEEFLEEAQHGLEVTDVPASGQIGSDLLFMVIKPR